MGASMNLYVIEQQEIQEGVRPERMKVLRRGLSTGETAHEAQARFLAEHVITLQPTLHRLWVRRAA